MSQPQAKPIALDISTVLRVLFVQRWVILGTTFATGAVLFCISFLFRDTYKAMAIVMPPDRMSNSLSMLSAIAGSSGGSNMSSGALAALSMKNPADLYVALMSSPGVEDAVVQRFELQKLYKVKHASQARKAFEHHSQITADAKSGLITVSVTDHDPKRAAELTNAIISAYDQTSSRLAITEAQRRRLFFERQVSETKENLSNAEEALRNTSVKTGVIEPEGDARALIAYEANLRAQISVKTVQLEAMKVNLSPETPQVQTAQRELQGMEGEVNELTKKTGGDATFASRSTQTDASLDYLRKLREVRYNESLFELLLKNLELAKLDEAREGNVVQVVDAASAPDMRDGPFRSFFLAGGLLLGALCSSAWAVFRYAWLTAVERPGA